VKPPHTNFSFDERVVSLYNRQRAHPPEVARAIGAAIAAHTPATAPVLEIGVGTGRIALPVVAAGRRVIGFDLSPQMLGEAHSIPALADGSLSLAQADMHAMPFRDDAFGAVLAVHVLHLARDWQQVLREMVRVLHPEGVFIQGEDWMDPQSVMGRLRDELRQQAVRLDASLMPPAALVSRGQLLAQMGAGATEEIVAAEWTTHISAAERLAVIEQRIDAESWILSPALFSPVMTHLRDFAASLWPDLEAPQPVTRRFILKITRGDW
jgi:SAM-dependent methyltransferase